MDNNNIRKKTKLLAIFFDLDNTLIQTRKGDVLACNKLAEILWEKHSIPPDVAKKLCSTFLKSFRKCPSDPSTDLDTWRCHLWTQALGDQYNKLADDVYKKWLELRFDFLALTPEIQSLLRTLHQHYFIGLITNGPSKAQWEKVQKLNLRTFFDIILVSGDLAWEKPHHEIFHKACFLLGIEPHQCIMVGDKLDTDILGGIKAKLGGTVWVPLVQRDLGQSEPSPDYVIRHVTELPSLLPNIKTVPKFRGIARNLCLSDVDDCNSNSSDGS